MQKHINFYFIFILLAIFFRVIGAISSKYAAITLSDVTIFFIISNIFYIITILCLFLNAIVWQQALMHYSLSFAYPFFLCNLNFLVLIASAILFNEGVTFMNILGMVIISVGITILSRNNGGSIV